MKIGDSVMISPDVTHKEEWELGKVIEIENNPFVGIVIAVKTDAGDIYFEKESLFKFVS